MEMAPGDSELSTLIEDIMSLERERRDLLDSLTPTISRWEHQVHDGGGENKSQAAMTWRGRKDEEEEPYVPKENFDEDLGNLFDAILEDMEGLGHRMLSTAHLLDKPGRAPLPLYKADELVSRTSRLMHASQEFYKETKKKNKNNHKQEEHQEGQGEPDDDFVSLCRSYLQSPDRYKNELALILTAEDEKKEKEKNQKKKEKEEEEAAKWNNKTEKEKDPSTVEFLKRRMTFHEIQFALHRACWERVWGSYDGRRGGFKDTTTLSSMRFTHYTPDALPFPAAALGGSTLQIYYVKIIVLKGNLRWPLRVKGLVAARDTLDRNRNILFSRIRHNYQVVTENHPYLRLTGPSRGILAVDPVDFEVELEIEGAGSSDRASIRLHKSYYAKGSTSLFFKSPNCLAELSVGRLATRIQATILGVRIVEGHWPFKRGCRVVCSSSSTAAAEATPREVVLLDYLGEEMRVGSGGYLHLSRNVVSVDLQGTLRVVIQAYSRHGRRAQEGHVDFPAQQCQTSKSECFVANSKLEIVVAWSLLMNEKPDLLGDCPPY
ncbi:unnamed protein product [Alopecurus aequalis]